MTLLLIAIGGALGASARYLTDRAVQMRYGTAFPWGTLTVNIVGSFLLGLVTAASPWLDSAVAAGMAIGLCGGFTTYSTFGYETLRLAEDGAGFLAAANAITSVGGGLGAVSLGLAVGAAFA